MRPSPNNYEIKNYTDEEYQKVLKERGEAWDKHLEAKKTKYISKESQIGIIKFIFTN